jgi:hypothetical protein
MIIQEGYLLTELAGETYLLPYGQNIATYSRGLKLNESGRLIWLALAEGATKHEIVERLAVHFEADEEDLPGLEADVDTFLDRLRSLGVLEQAFTPESFPISGASWFLIGGIRLQLHLPKALISPEFLPFETKPDHPDISISVSFTQPGKRPVGQVLLHNRELLILDAATGYHLIFLESPDIIECHLDKEGKSACFFCRKADSESLCAELFHGIRFAYLLCAQKKGIFAIHSASVLYREKAWLFAAPSGTGKSTHALHWKELFEVPLLNGDLNLLCIDHDKPVVYGLPWCGTSGIYTSESHPLGGIVFLQQSQSNRVVTLAPDRQQLMLSQRLISPTWTREQLLTNLKFCGKLSPMIPCFLLQCTREEAAAKTCRAAIDEMLPTD